MLVGIFSDVHGNLEALDAVLKRLKSLKVSYYLCLGDLVGYGANPNECVERVKELPGIVVAGNHDWAAIGKTSIEYFNPVAKEAILWTREQLKNKTKDFLFSLPLKATYKPFLLVHSVPSEPDSWRYIFTVEEAMSEFDYFSTQVCLVGHSHQPLLIELDRNESPAPLEKKKIEFRPLYRYLINVGSVGQPRDSDPRACFATFDTEKRIFQLYRIDYNIKGAQEKILKAGLPPFLAERLEWGR